MNARVFKPKDEFRFSRSMYILEALFEYFISILTSGAYLAKLTTTIGISDSMTAILSTITSLAGLFQIISIYLAHKTPVKRWIVPMQFTTQLLLATLYVIPLSGFSANASVLFFIIIFTARSLSSVASPIKYNWFMELVHPTKRGSFTAFLQIISVIGAMIFSFTASSVIDAFEKAKNMRGAFLTITVTILVISVLHLLTLILAKEKHTESEKSESPFASVKMLFKNKHYTRILILYLIVAIGASITSPFLGTYQIKELGFSLTFISIIDIFMSICQILFLFFFGRYSMRHSYAKILYISYFFAILAYILVAFSNESNGAFVYTAYRTVILLMSSAQAVSSSNLIFSIAPPEERTSALAINTIITGVIGFLVTLSVTPFVDYVQANGFLVFGIQLYAQQALAIVSAIVYGAAILYFRLVCKRGFQEAKQLF